MRHLDYISDLVVISPRIETSDPSGFVEVKSPSNASIKFVSLPYAPSLKSSIIKLPTTVATIVREVRNSDIVHGGAIGWPIPLGFFANPAAVLLGKKLIIVIESSPWRVLESEKANLKRRIMAGLVERLVRWSIKKADLRIFTSEAYRDSLVAGGDGVVLVNPASWIDEGIIPSDAEVERRWSDKSDTIRLIFAGSLTESKGVPVLLDAARELERRGIAVQLDIIGQGALGLDCEKTAAKLRTVRMKLLAPVPYGPEFFATLSEYDVTVVPTLSDEQPRIIYDAFSQGVPVIASDTGGNRDCVRHGETGYLVPPGDAQALANTIEYAVQQRQELPDLAKAAISMARSYTHAEMHRKRAKVLRKIFGEIPARRNLG